jgi:tRNA (mo5U34)-methyltransferase
MPVRSFGYRGFRLTVEVPPRVGEIIRRWQNKRAARGPGLQVERAPQVAVKRRDEELALVTEFISTAGSQSDIRSGNGQDEIASHTWYHTIELPDGTVTYGRWDHRPLLPHYGLPERLNGKRVLDVGSGDGFWAFELERRGADVTSIDIEFFADADLPRAVHDVFRENPVSLPFRRGLEIAHRQLASNVRVVNASVYDLDPDEIGTFDFVHAGDILLHLRDPALALQKLCSVTSGTALLADVFDPTLDGIGAGPGLTRYHGGWTDATWWVPSLSTLTQMVADAGFRNVEVVTTYTIEDRAGPGPWHAVIRAQA